MSEEKELKYGQVIDIPEEHLETFASLNDLYEDATVAFHAASHMLKIRNRDMNKFVRATIPEVEGWEWTLLIDKKQIVLSLPVEE